MNHQLEEVFRAFHNFRSPFSLMLRFVDDSFDANEQPTIGVDFRVKNLEIDGQRVSYTA
jgi:hypothetical protein